MAFRQYQSKLITGLASCLTKFRKIVGQLPTGGGKTYIFCGIADRYLKKQQGRKVVIAVHRKELLQQTRRSAFNAFGLDCQPIIAGMKYIPEADIYVAMVETLHRLISKGKQKVLGDVGLLIIDECHIANFNKIHEFFPETLIIGFSATPLSSSKKIPLKNFYEEIVCGPTIKELIRFNNESPGDGLCQNVTWAPKDVVNRKELEVKGVDFDEGLMALKFGQQKYVSNTVSAYERWGHGTKTIIFNVNIEHSQKVCAAFEEKGYECKHLDGEMSKTERERVISWFKTTPKAILCNVGIATTGFDEPSIETVIINKATRSMPLWIQMCGRGSRPTEWKSMFTIIDMGGNAITHGDWSDDRNWHDIFHNPPKPGKEQAAPMKSCPQCEGIVPASTRVCPLIQPDGKVCGFEWPSSEITVESELYEFVMVTKDINITTVMEEHKTKKQYYSIFKVGRDIAADAKKTIPQMTDDYFNFILLRYYELCKEWCHKQPKPKRMDQWHKTKFAHHLFEEIKSHFPKWETKLVFTSVYQTYNQAR